MTTRLEPETDVQFEVWQDGDMVASADALSDAEHFMLVYGQDGPVEAKTAITTRFPGFHMVSAAAAPTPAPDGMREAIAGPAAWLNRWAAHVGNCTGGTECTCGLWLAQFEMEKALAIIAKGEGRE